MATEFDDEWIQKYEKVKDELYKEVTKIKNSKGSPTELLEIYQKAYETVVNRM